MKKPIVRLWVGLITSLLCAGNLTSGVHAQSFTLSDLTLIEVKMTGSETIVIQNTSGQDLNLQNYLIQYFNKHNPASLSAPTDAQLLPEITLKPKQAILLNSDSAATCGAAAVAEMEFTLSDTSGYLMLVKVETLSDTSILHKPQDRISWTSSASGADLVKVPSATTDAKAVWYRKIADGTWQQAILGNDCTLLMSMIESADTPTYAGWAMGEEPPSTILGSVNNATGTSAILAANIGLSAPQLTELLPNTASPQTDSEDEFIELYNSNSKNFDLGGFSLEVGLNTKRSYKIPSGITIAPKSFKAFFSSETSLALTNTGSQVRLLDQSGNVIGQTEAYQAAKDGQSWALAGGKWYWSTSSTPGSANVIKQPAATSTSKKSSSTKSAVGLVKGISTTTPSSATRSTLNPATDSAGKVHPFVLAGVGSMALLYGLYEYRNDVANQFHRLRRYREARRGGGPAA